MIDKIVFLQISQPINRNMKKQFFLTTIFIFLTVTSFAQTQLEINRKASISYANVDKELNLVYQSILKEYREDTLFIKNLKIAQNLWIKLRDADISAIFLPDGLYGSIEPLCRYGILETMTKDRIKFLKTWSEGLPEGDGCSGTRKTKQ
jgi:uncharacterized protein YecT (DUF1311 family)